MLKLKVKIQQVQFQEGKRTKNNNQLKEESLRKSKIKVELTFQN